MRFNDLVGCQFKEVRVQLYEGVGMKGIWLFYYSGVMNFVNLNILGELLEHFWVVKLITESINI